MFEGHHFLSLLFEITVEMTVCITYAGNHFMHPLAVAAFLLMTDVGDNESVRNRRNFFSSGEWSYA